jgi:chemotaxis protein methyltransferase CheR
VGDPARVYPADSQLEAIELQLLLEGVFLHYGYDFRHYALASIRRRVWDRVRAEELATISQFQDKVLHDSRCMERLLYALSVHMTAMFRDPEFFRAFRTEVVPVLRTYPYVRIWHAGCSSGEEVYSMAILLEEEGLLDRCRIYATDMNDAVLARARTGRFPLRLMREYTQNYNASGGKRSFSEYFTVNLDQAVFRPDLRRTTVFSQHNLATDSSFNEFHVVLCRNVMIYFNRTLQDRVHQLIYESLIQFGILGLGNRESLRLTPREKCYEALDERNRLYRRVV